ncbi:synapse differentiation-inducing gene protein 1-like [Spea bombifrons]|uniref:synapse differentiation-inducing gene protein 1-like n=1 Tax=Spea bombifrons TaxID=233779 RepID=UPI00234BC328|nr:synapse differentiation-inducing gene protein 1-like [Spea bombifrons]
MPEERSTQNAGFAYGNAQTQPRTRDYFWFSIVNLVCCCFPLGIAAIIYSRKTRDAVLLNDIPTAAKHSRVTLILNVVALILGIIFAIVFTFIYYKFLQEK